MGILKLILFLIFTLSSHIHVTTSVSCNTHSFCGNLGFPITYPFHLLNNPQQKSNYNTYCPYQPGFGLTCNILESKLILNLPYSGDFYVKNISYFDQRISLVDQCLPKRLAAKALSLISSPFVAAAYQDFRLYGCPPNINIESFPRYTYVPCMSNSSVSVVVVSTFYVQTFLSVNCYTAAYGNSFRVPVVHFNYTYYGGLENEISLSWENTFPTTCYDATYCDDDINPSSPAGSPAGTPAYKYPGRPASKGNGSGGYLMLIVLPFLVVVLLIIIRCKRSDRRRSLEVEAASQNTATTVRQDLTAAAHPTAPPIECINESVIEMCTVKLIVGESFRELVNSDYYSKICAICLSDFSPKETIRCIVECQHYYHADCIEEWLRIKCLCPVCRNPLI